jgi:hypothetical protein
MTNHVSHAATGVYGLAFDGVGGSPGTFQVSAFGTTPRVCAIAEWSNNAGPAQADVRCFNFAGEPANATFVVNWLTATGSGSSPGPFGFGINTSPSSNCGSPIEAFITNGSIETCPSGSVSRWKFEPIGSNNGTALVTALAHRPIDAPNTISPGICNLVSFYPHANISPGFTDEWVDVHCFQMDGTPDLYRENIVWFLKDTGMKGLDVTNVAYLFANKPTTGSYSPLAAKTFSTGGSITVRRLGVGRYQVTLPGMPKGGSAQVSPYLGSDTATLRVCLIASITKKTTPTKVGVRCFKRNGNLVDAKFTLAYAR